LKDFVMLGSPALLLALALTASAVHAAPFDKRLSGSIDWICGGTVVQLPGAAPSSPAVLLTNGHCLPGIHGLGMIPPGTAYAGIALPPTPVSVWSKAGKLVTAKMTRLLYATMTATDIALIQLDLTNQALLDQGVRIVPISDRYPAPADAALLLRSSAEYQQVSACKVGGRVEQLREGDWTFWGPIWLTKECAWSDGTSGSAILDPVSGAVVAIANTTNEDGSECGLENPCEVGPGGQISVVQGRPYAQRVDVILPCIGPDGLLKLANPGCRLSKKLANP
jgi:hypothetical protein